MWAAVSWLMPVSLVKAQQTFLPLIVIVAVTLPAGAPFGTSYLPASATTNLVVVGRAGGVGSAPVVRGALTRGGTRGGTAALVGLAGLVVAALALVPAVGYLEAVTASVLAVRLRRHSGKRFAGLRILARD